MPKPYPIKPSMGGRLVVTNLALENVGEANYTVKRNWRRVGPDREGLREGDLYFRPNLDLPQGVQALNTAEKLTFVAEVVRPNGDRSVVAGTPTTLYRYTYATATWDTIASGLAAVAQRWEVRDTNGYLIFNNAVDLPMTFRHEDTLAKPIYELREAGVAAVGRICVADGYLMCADVAEIQAAELPGVMNSADPYGLVAPALTNRIRYRVIWCDKPGEPRRWAPKVPATIAAAGSAATLAFPVSAETLATGMRIAVIGAAVNGGTLGGQAGGAETGLLVTGLTGTALTWDGAFPSDNAATYPLAVQVLRFADLSTLSGASNIQDDSSGVIAMEMLGRTLVLYRDSGLMYTGRYTAQREQPWVFMRVETGNNKQQAASALRYRWTLIANGEVHLYAAADSFYSFDGSGAPRLEPTLEDAKSLFYDGLSTAQEQDTFAMANPITHEIWFCTPQRTLAYDTRFGSCAEIDQVYTAGALIVRPRAAPGPNELWFVMASAEGAVYPLLQYGRTKEALLTVQRRGVAYACVLRSGLIALGDEFHEKLIGAYVLQLASQSANADVTVSLYATDDSARVPGLLFTRLIEAPAGKSLIDAMYQAAFFQDEIAVSTEDNLMVEVSGRTFELNFVRTRGFARRLN